MRKLTGKKWLAFMLLCGALFLIGCGAKEAVSEKEFVEEGEPTKEIVIGFSQLGAESDWRTSNTQSMKETFTSKKGYRLIVEDGQQQQSNQIMAIRKFIQQEVDYIVLAPVTETGWDTVLQEAKDAGIPVIIVDRQVDVSDDSLFTCWVGSDFALEGKKAAEWLHQFALAKDISEQEIHIANIQGTMGASAQIGRTAGLEEGAAKYGWDLLAEISGEYTQAKGKEVMEALLKEEPQVNVVYCENDNMAMGAVEAIEASGKEIGSDISNGQIMVMSFDGVTKNIMRYILSNKISFDAGCNPHHGPRVETLIQLLEAGKKPDKFSYVEERIYSYDATVPSLEVDGNSYPVTVVTSKTLEEFQ